MMLRENGDRCSLENQVAPDVPFMCRPTMSGKEVPVFAMRVAEKEFWVLGEMDSSGRIRSADCPTAGGGAIKWILVQCVLISFRQF